MSEWYLFAVFVFLLAALLIWFYKRTPRSQRRREEKTFEREAKLFKLYQNIEDLMDGFEEYAEELRGSLGRDSEELKRRVEALETQHAAIRHELRGLGAPPVSGGSNEASREAPGVLAYELQAPKAVAQPAPQAPKTIAQPPPQAPQKPAAAPGDASVGQQAAPGDKKRKGRSAPLNRAQKVRILQAEGMDAVRIARELGLSLNEVNLIMQLDERPDASLH